MATDVYFYYGGYTHAANSVAVRSIQKSFVMSPFGKRHVIRHMWTIEGKLLGDRSSINSQLTTLLTAYSAQGQSFGFLNSPLQVDSSTSIGGAMCTGPIQHEMIRGAEGTTYLRFYASLQADFPACLTGEVLDFHESLNFTNHGGGPIYVERTPAQGEPLFQQVTERSWYYVTQTGSITTAFYNPQPMLPIWPAYVRTIGAGGLNVEYNSPKMQRGVAMSYTTRWRYDYASPIPLEAYPNVVA